MTRTMSPFLDGQRLKSQSVISKPAKKPQVIVKRGFQNITGPFTNPNYGILGETGGAKYPAGMSSSGSGVIIDVLETLQNARAASHLSPHARTLIKRATDLTVDKGLPLEPTPAWEQLGIDDEDFKEKWISDHEQRFHMFMASKQIHRSQTMTGYQLQRFGQMCSNRDNDQYIRVYYNRSPEYMSPVQIEFIDPTQIRGGACVDSYGNQFSGSNGIEYDEAGRETAYLIRSRQREKNGTWKWTNTRVPARGPRSGRVYMFHWFNQEYTGQGRGFSPLHFCVQELENILDYQLSQIKLAINQSSFVGWVVPSEDKPASNPNEILQGISGFEDDLPITVTIDESKQQYRVVNVKELNNRAPGSNFYTNLNAGEDIKFPSQTAPNSSFDKFLTSVFSYISAARGWPLEVVVMMYNSNYSASRAAILDAWRTGGIERDDIDADMMSIVYHMWLSEEIAAGRSQCPGWSDPRLKQAWLQHRLQAPAIPSIDPGKDRAAIEKDLKFQLTTQDAAARALNGSRVKDNIVRNRKTFAETPNVPWDDAPAQAETKEANARE